MSQLELKLADSDYPDAVYGSYSDRQALAILQQYLRGSISDYSAASRFAGILPAAQNPNSHQLGLGQLGDFLYRMAEQIPYSHPAQSRLVQLIMSLQKSAKLSLQVEGYLIWTGMGSFQGCLRENFPPTFDDDDPEFPDSYNNALNFSAFCARLTQCGFLDHSSFPIWEMRTHLETKMTDHRAFQFAISSAALWFIFAGQAIYSQVIEAPNYPRASPEAHKTGELYNGPEMGLERWRFWKDALSAAGGDKEVDEEHCILARRGSAVMDAIEQSMMF